MMIKIYRRRGDKKCNDEVQNSELQRFKVQSWHGIGLSKVIDYDRSFVI